MATQADVRRIAMALPEVEEGTDRFGFSVRGKGIAWVWLERVHPKKARIPNAKFLAVRVGSLTEKDMMIAADPVKFFTEPHYNGYPAVLVRLEEVTVADLRPLLRDAWRCQAPRDLLRAGDEGSATKRPNTKRPSTKTTRAKTTAKTIAKKRTKDATRPDTSAARPTRASRARTSSLPKGRGTDGRSSPRS